MHSTSKPSRTKTRSCGSTCANRLMPRLKLRARTTGTRSEACRKRARWASDCPVVPTTSRAPCSVAAATTCSVQSACEKSTTTASGPIAASRASTRRNGPSSSCKLACAAGSHPTTGSNPARRSAVATRRPMRPAAPLTITAAFKPAPASGPPATASRGVCAHLRTQGREAVEFPQCRHRRTRARL